jgi:hypothetical protein
LTFAELTATIVQQLASFLGATEMDFIEQWFGVSPDGGDGSLELLWIVLVVFALIAIAFRRRISSWLMPQKRGEG